MDVFLFVGLPIGVFLVAFVWAGYAIGANAASQFAEPPAPPTPRQRTRRTVTTLIAAAIAALGAMAAASAGAFSRVTDEAYVIEPAALILIIEATVDLALAAVVALPGWSPGRAWVLRTVGLYWLCLAGPVLILSDAGPGWMSADPAAGLFFLGLPAFCWEIVAVVVPALLIWLASRANARPSATPSEPATPS
jgi:hypothetical protein